MLLYSDSSETVNHLSEPVHYNESDFLCYAREKYIVRADPPYMQNTQAA